jgi:hypothetical protein
MQLTVTICCQGHQRAALPLISWHVHGHMGGDAFPEPECRGIDEEKGYVISA